MLKKILTLVLISSLLGSLAAQDNSVITPDIREEMTDDSNQDEKWRIGEYEYSAKPKHAWELGIHLGHFFIDGDVDEKIFGGYGLGLHLRRAIHYVFSLRADFFYGQASGLETQPWRHRTEGGGLVEPVFAPYRNGEEWFPSYRTRQVYGALQGVLNIGNILFHKERNKWNWYMTFGAGFGSHKAMLDLLDENGNTYTDLLDRTNWTAERFNTQDGRSDIKSRLSDIYDGDYETEGFKKAGIFRLGDETNIHFLFTSSMGVARKLSRRINIGLEHQLILQDNDYLDGIKFRSAVDQTNNADIQHYTNIRLAINLGSLSDGTEPLYWLNPLDATMNDIAELKQRPVLDLTDDDGDGIINMLDQEMDTPSGCPVDTRGITLDSDGDGIPDCKDQEPYSPPGYDVDTRGIAEIPNPGYMSEQDVNALVDTKAAAIISTVRGEWFLPMIHFDLDKYNIKPEFYGHLHHVATVMNMYPDLCVTVFGHTDIRSSNSYNNVLSFNRAEEAMQYLMDKYGFSRDRFKLMYGGEEAPLASQSKGEAQHYMNRRVEFRVCQDDDQDMARPEGPNAGTGKRSSSYSGNKNSGY